MAAFKAGETQLLVATTVIEVGVDVPEATIMVVEHAERFGLAQLHQLRGRVGRGSGKSTCLLVYHEPLGETAKARLKTMRETDDGFVIAEEDLRLRGPGEVLGRRQSGLEEFRLADPVAHADLLAVAHDDARLILARDPDLKSPRGEALRVLLYLFGRDEARALLCARDKKKPAEAGFFPASPSCCEPRRGLPRPGRAPRCDWLWPDRPGPGRCRPGPAKHWPEPGHYWPQPWRRRPGPARCWHRPAAALAWTCALAASPGPRAASAWASSFCIWALAASALAWWKSAFACSRAIGSASAGLAMQCRNRGHGDEFHIALPVC